VQVGKKAKDETRENLSLSENMGGIGRPQKKISNNWVEGQ